MKKITIAGRLKGSRAGRQGLIYEAYVDKPVNLHFLQLSSYEYLSIRIFEEKRAPKKKIKR